MKKKLISLILVPVCAIACAFGFTACDGDGDDNGSGHNKHTFDKQVVGDLYLCTPATCTEKATYYYSCECGERGTETFEGGSAPSGHSFTGRDSTNSAYLASEETCTSAATYYFHCINCGKVGTETFEEGVAEGHKYVGGKCSVCQQVQPTSEGLEFVLNEDGASYGVKKGTCTDTQILIPATHEGKPVTAICESAFESGSQITSVTLPDSITVIGSYAFAGTSITSINIPDNVTEIGWLAFSTCVKLKTVTIGSGLSTFGTVGKDVFNNCYVLETLTVAANNATFKSVDNCLLTKDGTKLVAGCTTSIIPDGVTTIGTSAFRGSKIASVTIPESVTVIEAFAFSDCSEITSLTLPANLTTIGDSAFDGCYCLTSLVVPNKVTHIGWGAISNCYELKSVVIPATVSDIESSNLSNCDNLETAEVPVAVVEDMSKGSLKTLKILGAGTLEAEALKDCTTLKVLDISEITEVGEDAFSGCTSLEEVKMPTWAIKDIPQGSLKVVVITQGAEIEDDAFKGCSTLTHITLPESLRSIGDGVFLDCPALELITFEGTRNQWDAIAYGKDWNPTNPLPAFRLECLK